MTNFSTELKTKLLDLTACLKNGIAELKTDSENTIAEIRNLREYLREVTVEQHNVANVALEFGTTLTVIGHSMTPTINKGTYIVETLDEIDDDDDDDGIVNCDDEDSYDDDDDDDDVVGSCANCGATIYDDDEWDEGDDGELFCNDICMEKYYADTTIAQN